MNEYNHSNNSEPLIFILDNGVKFFPERRYIADSSGFIINLSENSYRFLTLLLKGETDKQNIINQVWHEQRGSVSDSSYYGQIYSLRKTLDLVGISSSAIKTLPRRGVKYMGKVEMVQDVNSVSCQYNDLPNNLVTEPMSVTSQHVTYDTGNKNIELGWINSRHWNILITVMAVISVCWLTTLSVAVFIFLL